MDFTLSKYLIMDKLILLLVAAIGGALYFGSNDGEQEIPTPDDTDVLDNDEGYEVVDPLEYADPMLNDYETY